MGAVISSFLWKCCGSRNRPRLDCIDEVDSYNQCASHEMTSSVSLPFSSSHARQIKYDIFISFRGLDTRWGFLSHLLTALSQRQIEVFVDYELRKGNELWPAFSTAIEESQIALIILSKDYASSKWCLDELVKITECRMKYGQIVVPIFYNIDPSDVRRQKGCYKDAFTEYEKAFEDNIEKWKSALRKVADLSGFHSTNFGTEAELIEEVVQLVLERLNHMPHVDLQDLVGINKPIEDLQSRILCIGSKDVRIIGIWGMGGIGKTTIAEALFRILCSEYEGFCFLANIREQAEKYEIIQLKDKLLSILLDEKDHNTSVPHGAPAYVLRRLGRKKILVVLDDVNDQDQVKNLIGDGRWLGPGSRIIVTARDKNVLHVLCKEADDIYEVKALGFHEALQLFTMHAFKECFQMKYHNLMWKVVRYANGNPLALKVLGSFLCGKSVEEWESQLQKLQKMPFAEIQNILRLSYEGLDRQDKRIFLYIACFFSYESEGVVKVFLDACGYSTAIALKTLQDKALITLNQWGDIFTHGLIREMDKVLKSPERDVICGILMTFIVY